MAPLATLIVKALVSAGANKAVEHFTQPKGMSHMEMILGVIRHILTAGGGMLAAKGYMDTETVEAVAGAIITLIGTVWSIVSKKKTPE